MSMTKKDYELVARIFHKNITDTNPKVTEVRYSAAYVNAATALQFADVLQRHDKRFNRLKFLEQCGAKSDCEHINRTITVGNVVCKGCGTIIHAIEED